MRPLFVTLRCADPRRRCYWHGHEKSLTTGELRASADFFRRPNKEFDFSGTRPKKEQEKSITSAARDRGRTGPEPLRLSFTFGFHEIPNSPPPCERRI